MATGTNLFTSHEARILAHTPNNTTTFLRGDNSWSNTLTGDLTVNNLYVTDSGIYYVGTQETYRMIRFIDNTADTYGNGISIGGGGLTVLGSGESADTILSNLTLTAAGGTETTYIGSDGGILFYPEIYTWDASTLVTIAAGKVWAGVNGDTTRETQVGVQSGAGQLYMWSHASTEGSRGLYAPAHGTGGATVVLEVNTNNYTKFNGHLICPDAAVSYIAGAQGLNAAVYAKKNSGSRWYPAVALQTAGGGAWQIGNYDDETLEFQYATAANISSNTNSVSEIYMRAGDTGYVMTSGNYTDLTVTKTGTGASGTWGINITGRAYSLKDRTNDNTSYLNYGAAGLAASAITWLCCWNGYEVRAISKAEMRNAVSSPYMVTESYPALMPTNASNNWIKVGTANSSYGLLPSQSGGAGGGHNYLGTSSWYWKYAYIDEIYSVHTRGAVWNDYAEYRKAYEYEPGYAISPSGRYTKTRLESGARIISDTYGFAIGYMENRKDMAPVAISGRVLAYPLHNKSYYKIGDAVCATKDGKIDKMTRKEIKEYPDRIIGIVNEIPDYDIWEPSREGGITEPIHTNGRIWIDVR